MLAVWLLADKDLSMQCPEVIVLRPPSPLNTPNQMRHDTADAASPDFASHHEPETQLVNGVNTQKPHRPSRLNMPQLTKRAILLRNHRCRSGLDSAWAANIAWSQPATSSSPRM